MKANRTASEKQGKAKGGKGKRLTKPQGKAVAGRTAKKSTLIRGGRVHEELTKSKRAEEASHESEKNFRNLLQAAPDAIVVVDQQGKIVMVNSQTEAQFGYMREEMLGQPVEILIPEQFRKIHIAHRSVYVSAPSVRSMGRQLKLAARRKDGSEFPVEISLSPLRTADGYQVIAAIRDITERKLADDKLRAAEAKYRALIEQIPPIVYTAEPEQHVGITYISPQIERLGFQQEQWISDPNLWLRQLHPDDRERVLAQLQELERSDQQFQGEYRLISRDGQVRWFYDNAFPVKDDEGRTLFRQGFMLDITDRKQAESHVRQYADIVGNMQIGLYVFHLEDREDDRSLRIISANPAALEFSGVMADEILGKTLDEAFPDLREQGIPQKYAEVVRAQDSVQIEVTYYDDAQQLDTVYAVKAFPLPNDHLGVAFENITERRRAEETLRQNQMILAQAGKMAHLGAWEIEFKGYENVNDNPLRWSDEVYRIFGYEPGSVQVTNGFFFECVHPDDRQKIAEAFGRALAEKKPYEIEHRIIRPDGSERIVLEHGDTIYGEDGQPLRLFGAVQDITERKQIEGSLRESEERFRNLFENSPLAIWEEDFSQVKAYLEDLKRRGITDLNAHLDEHPEVISECLRLVKVLDVNQAALKLYEVNSKSDLLGDLDQTFPQESLLGFKHELLVVASGGLEFQSESIVNTRLGSHRIVSLNWAVAPGSEQTYSKVLVSLIDITERKQAEEKLRDSEKRFRALIENSADAIALIDGEGRILFESPPVTRILGYEIEEMIGRSAFEFIHPDDYDSIMAVFAEILHQPGKIVTTQTRYRHKDGSWLWVEGTGANLLNEPAVGAIVVNYRDITDRKQAEEKLRDSEKLFRALIENSSEEVSLLAADGRLLYESPSTNPTLGYAAGEYLGQSMFQLVHPDDLARVQTLFSDLVQTPGSDVRDQFRLRHQSGEWRWVEAVGTNLLNELSVQAVVVNYHDITDRKEAEQKLRESEEKLRNIIRHSSSMFYTHTPDHVLIYVSPQSREILDCEPEEAKVRWQEFLSDNTANRQGTEATERAIATGERQPIYELELVTRLGRKIWVQVDESPVVSNGKTIAVVGSLTDITARRQAENALQTSEQRYRALFEDSPVSIWEEDFSEVKTYFEHLRSTGVTDFREYFEEHPEAVMECIRRVRVLDVNRTTLDMLEVREKSELLGALSASPHTDAIPTLKAELINFAEGKLFYEGDGVFQTRQGGTRNFFIRLTVAPGYEETLGRVFTSIVDITERKQAEEALRLSEERYHALFEDSPVSIWEEDFSQLKKRLDSLRANGISDLRAYFAAHPDSVEEFSSLIQILDVNKAALRMYGADSKEELIQSSVEVLSKGERENNISDFIAIAEGRTSNYWEGADETLAGEPIEVSLGWSVLPGHEEDYSKVIVTVIDITERKKAQNELQASEERFRLLASNIREVFWITDPISQKDVYISPAYEEVWARRLEEQMQNQNLFIETILSEDRQMVLETIESQIRGVRTEMEYRIRRPDGSIRWIWDRAFPILDESRNVKLITGIAADVTERKISENRLRESEERYHRIAGTVPGVLFDYWLHADQTNEFTYVSPRARDILEIEAEDLMRDSSLFWNMIHPDDLERYRQEDAAAEQQFHTEVRVITPSGQVKWIQIESRRNSVKQGDAESWSGVMIDVTMRKLAQKEAERHLMELEALYENGLAVSRLFDEHKIGARTIQTVEQYLSWHHVTIRLRKNGGDDLELIAFSVPHLKEEDRQSVEQNFTARVNKVGQGMSGWAVKTGVPVRTGNVHTHPQYVDTYEGIQSGMYMPLRVGERVIGCISVESEVADAFTAQDERLLATLANQAAVAFENARLYQAIQQELGERRHAEAMLEQERNSLAQRVEERTAELIAANSNLARALRVKDEFLANMSHELRTPLNAILGLSESLGEQVAGSLNAKQQKYVQTITESGHHLLALINDILDLAKIEAGQVTLDIAKVDVHSLCESSLRMVRQLARMKNQDISLEIDEKFGLIWADERRLKQMIVNLLSNAVKFTPEGGRIGLEVHGDEDENRVLITVWDNGIGIAEEDIARLFQPFVQLSTGLARESTGTGLGLTLVAQMARLHGGGVSVSSLPGTGSRFTLVLPWEPALALDTMERMKVTGKFRAIRNLAEHERRTLLLIEDTDEVVMMVRDYLESAGFNVATAGDGLEGIAQAKRVHPDLILMDLQMPRMDGFEATRRLRSEPEFVSTPIIALTALAMQGDRERCLAAGMDEYITKPVNLKALVKIIKACLTRNEGESNAEKAA